MKFHVRLNSTLYGYELSHSRSGRFISFGRAHSTHWVELGGCHSHSGQSDGEDRNSSLWRKLNRGRSARGLSVLWLSCLDLLTYTMVHITLNAHSHSACQKYSAFFMETEGSVPCSQKPDTSSYPDPDASCPHLPTLFP